MPCDNGWCKDSIPVSTYVSDSQIHTGEAINLSDFLFPRSIKNKAIMITPCFTVVFDD